MTLNPITIGTASIVSGGLATLVESQLFSVLAPKATGLFGFQVVVFYSLAETTRKRIAEEDFVKEQIGNLSSLVQKVSSFAIRFAELAGAIAIAIALNFPNFYLFSFPIVVISGISISVVLFLSLFPKPQQQSIPSPQHPTLPLVFTKKVGQIFVKDLTFKDLKSLRETCKVLSQNPELQTAVLKYHNYNEEFGYTELTLDLFNGHHPLDFPLKNSSRKSAGRQLCLSVRGILKN